MAGDDNDHDGNNDDLITILRRMTWYLKYFNVDLLLFHNWYESFFSNRDQTQNLEIYPRPTKKYLSLK